MKQGPLRTFLTLVVVVLGLVFLLGLVPTFGPAIWITLPILSLAFLAGVYVVLERVPVGTLLIGEVGTSALLVLVGATAAGACSILALSVLSLSRGLGQDLAAGIQAAAKGKAIRPEFVVFLSTFALVALWICFLRGRRFLRAKREAQALAQSLIPPPAHRPDEPASPEDSRAPDDEGA